MKISNLTTNLRIWPAQLCCALTAALPVLTGSSYAAETTGQFSMPHAWAENQVQDAFQQTQVRISCTQTHIVAEFAAEAVEPSNDAVTNDANTWELGDVLEFFVEDPRARYYTESHVTPEGVAWSKKFFTHSPGGRRNWESEFNQAPDYPEVSSEVSDGVWKARIAVPYEMFSVDGQRPPVIRWVTCRIDTNDSNDASETVLSSSGNFPLDETGEKGLSFHRDRSFWHTSVLSESAVWTGVDHFVLSPTGVIPRRVTPLTISAMSKIEAFIARLSSGVQLHFDAEGVKEFRATIRTLNDDGFPTNWALYIDGLKVHPTYSVPAGSKDVRTLTWKPSRFAIGKTFTLYFPTHAEVELRSVELIGEPSGKVPNLDLPETRWLVHGDSITHGANVTSPDFTWVEQVARAMDWHPINFGFGGIARAQAFFAEAIAARDDWDILSIHIGTNSYRSDAAEYAIQYDAFLDTIRAAHPNKPIVCATPIWHYPDADPEDGRTAGIRAAISKVVTARQASDPNLYLIDGLSLLGSQEGLLSDRTHPSDHGASKIAQQLIQQLSSIFKSTLN